ncbi:MULTISPECIES: ubiquinone anaerobic biosynthesis protein UbiU [unclassified Undibacterium]|uniref:ubiquinone anaerobic biosynthesis protein UbiU n=1 Tax=unclassified Undibacterium TaxID=2630295 RepID=UPI002AC8F67C|nr:MULTISPECIES: peptidase U32 family protein [unclassified Undibacterium]MEB0138084.1 peptidase U32 family protein [Undibacterium sp. CCC2.1]MEB0171178.1 peptidase U32 family protein [Undibacterium sp. CCC1.1]MEB0175223.1 peptidase U32 family protein [Undibacterium sp. CCC3.4]MEB0214631.1 peptidase U32 family protein [Undibacterium sp. 5I2]WPX42399.1 peptidase U32 family protein [Undibacterium sp. CCC3.4]
MKTLDLVAPAGSLVALKAAVDKGADAVYLGLRNATNARNFGGLNFSDDDISSGVEYAHRRGRQILFAINTFPQPRAAAEWRNAVDSAVRLGADAVILADPGLMAYARDRHPDLRLHLSVQGSATTVDAIELMREQFGIRRAVLPRVLSLPEIEKIIRQTSVEIEVFGFGSLCVMAEGRCLLSSYVTGDSPNNKGVCSPAHAVSWTEREQVLEARLSGTLIDRYAAGEAAAYPTLCKGRFLVDGEIDYALEEPTSLNAISLLPKLVTMGVAALKIEGRQRSPTYVGQVVATLRAALDNAQADPERYSARPEWQTMLARHAEGAQVTQGAFDRPWK